MCSRAPGARDRTSSAISANGWIVPTSLLTSMTDTSATGSAASASDEVVEVDDAVGADLHHPDLEPLGLQPVGGLRHRLVLDRAHDDPSVAARR